ncbi:MAG: hypothetical protein WA738_07650 [Candidatus Angelobacter sp.]
MARATNIGSDLELKACAEALQSAQKRTRIGFFFSLAASCIVVLMVLNLSESRKFLENLSKNNTDQSDYAKDYIKHIADNSFYQLPALGIQITCDDVGILGPLALLIFSFYSGLAFKACYCHVKCATRGPFQESSLIQALLETEKPLSKPLFLILRIFLFLPFVACLTVVWYGRVAHFHEPPNIPSLPWIWSNLTMAKTLDVIGYFCVLLVFFYNLQMFLLSQKTKSEAAACIQRHASSNRNPQR